MKVKELIELLKDENQDREVCVRSNLYPGEEEGYWKVTRMTRTTAHCSVRDLEDGPEAKLLVLGRIIDKE